MAESTVRTDKSFQLIVYGVIAVVAAAMMGAMALVLETSTIRWAGLLVLIGLLVAIAFLALEL